MMKLAENIKVIETVWCTIGMLIKVPGSNNIISTMILLIKKYMELNELKVHGTKYNKRTWYLYLGHVC